MAKWLTTQQVAWKLGISYSTVLRYRKALGISAREGRHGYWFSPNDAAKIKDFWDAKRNIEKRRQEERGLDANRS